MTDIEALLDEMNEAGASDVFLYEGRAPCWRLNGEIAQTLHPAVTRETLLAFAQRVLLPAQLELFERTGDLDAGFAHPRRGRFRLHLGRTRGLLGIVLRAVPTGQLEFDALGLPAVSKTLAELPRGLVLVCGATGSGKSTTLAAMVHHINATRAKHIVTLEDPIEFVHEDLLSIVTQREVGADSVDFASGLRSALRQNPDVILVGELRDAETVSVALSAALTGHLVLSTLHTLDAAQTLQRMLSYFPEKLREQVCMDLSLSLQGILAQRLLPRADGEGRVAAVEVVVATPAVRKLVREQRVDELADVMHPAEGMQTFNRALVDLYKKGTITFETGSAYATSPDEFRLNAQGLERGAMLSFDEKSLENEPGKVDMRALLGVALQHGASDIHLVAGAPPLLRLRGELRAFPNSEPLSPNMVRRLLFSLLSQGQRERYDLERELDFSLTVTGGHRFRVNAHYQRGTTAVAIRLVPNAPPPHEALHLPPVVLSMAEKTQGLFLVVGPTGSGKSTTLAALIDLINQRRACHVITIEDPVEFVHPNKRAVVEQRELGADTKSFAAALKHILRQDPDVILVGEMRDPETISAALTAAETGHLVFATLHSNDAPSAVDRIVDVFPPAQQNQVRTQLASELLGVLSQRLLMRADGRGRAAAFEVMVGTPAIRSLIRENKLHQISGMMEASARDGMVTLDRALAELVRSDVVYFEEASRYARNPGSLRAQIVAMVENARAAAAMQQAQAGAPQGGKR